MLTTLFYELIIARLVGNFASWLTKRGYVEEGNLIYAAMISWMKKEESNLETSSHES